MIAGRLSSVTPAPIPATPPKGLTCECGPHPVRPLPGYVCGQCQRYIVGPPQPHRDLSLHQTQHGGANRRSLSGIVGRKPETRTQRWMRRWMATGRAHA